MEHTLELGPVTASRIVGAWRMSQWDFSLEQRLAWIHGALERGVSTFDHADIYGNYDGESLFGEALAREPGLRARMQLVTKCNIMLKSGKRPAHRVKHYDSSAEHITESVHASLKNLRTDHLDVLLLHRPDMLLDADEVASAFHGLQGGQGARVRRVQLHVGPVRVAGFAHGTRDQPGRAVATRAVGAARRHARSSVSACASRR